MVLLGPAGIDTPHWLRLLKREHRVPEVKNESSGKALRIGRTLVDTVAEREALLAKMLVLQWQTQSADSSPTLMALLLAGFSGCLACILYANAGFISGRGAS